jgi:DNA-binding transcriptional ArsR family regulator
MQPDPITQVFRALSDPTRRSVFQRIAKTGEITVADLTRGSGVTQGAVSQHLKSLKLAGLVADRAEGRNIYYRANPQGLAPLAGWMDLHAAFWRDNFADLRKLLKDIDP